MRNKLFIFIFSALLLFGMVAAPVTKVLVAAGVVDFQDLANYKEPTQITSGIFKEFRQKIENVKAEIENVYVNYMPLYNTIINGVANVKDTVNAPSNKFLTQWGNDIKQASKPSDKGNDDTLSLPDDTTTVPETSELNVKIPGENVNPNRISLSDEVESVFLSAGSLWNDYALLVETEDGKELKMLERALNVDYSVCVDRAASQITELNRIADALPDVNFFVYFGTRLQETDYSDEYFPDVDSCKTAVKHFERKLSDNIAVSHFQLEDIEDKVNTYYLTDHHWNANGMIQAYYEIIDLFKTKIPDMTDAREPVAYYCDTDIKFNGIYSRSFKVYDTWDPLDIYDFDLPAHTQEGGRSLDETVELFENGHFESGYGLYEALYPLAQSYSYYTNDTSRNLLIIGDSFMYCENEVLASHFDNTYIMHICSMSDFDYKDFVEKNNITDVLVLCFDMRLIYNYNNDVHLERVKTN